MNGCLQSTVCTRLAAWVAFIPLILASPSGQAHPYIDIAHRASLLYAFAASMLAAFTEVSQLSNTLELIAVTLLVAYFAIAIIGYIIHGAKKDTDNQIKNMSAGMSALMWSLIVAEIGGFLIIFYGLITALM
jgi:peptidoglycan/LPS O-acetylase OafA/YrhL